MVPVRSLRVFNHASVKNVLGQIAVNLIQIRRNTGLVLDRGEGGAVILRCINSLEFTHA